MLKLLGTAAAAAALILSAPVLAQDQAWDIPAQQSAQPEEPPTEYNPAPAQDWTTPQAPADVYQSEPYPGPSPATEAPAVTSAPAGASIPREDLFSAAEGVFGRGAEGLAGILERILKEQGEPTAYIAGREAGGAIVFGVRYGSGVLRHQVEGDRTVYWTGPSLGFDLGADASKVFVLVYNLHDSQELFRRFPGAEGNAYFVGGFTAQYLRRGDVVLIPIRLGVGLRLGVNAGYMRFTERNRWVPF